MSDWYQALIDPEATLDTASVLADKAIRTLREQNIILPEPNDDCVLGGQGYPPGPALSGLYEFGDRECRYWSLITNGVEVTVGRWFNTFGVPVLEWLACPHCETRHQLDGQFGDSFGHEIGRWLNAEKTAPVVCESCERGSPVERWRSQPPLGFAMLTLQFWNWPAFGARGWKIDLPELLSAAIGHRLIHTWGRV